MSHRLAGVLANPQQHLLASTIHPLIPALWSSITTTGRLTSHIRHRVPWRFAVQYGQHVLDGGLAYISQCFFGEGC